jgi:glutathione S-transferase
MITVHNFARGGARGRRVMWLCEEMGLRYRLETHDYPVDAAYRAKNPSGRVPFLEDSETGVAMGESLAMLIYLATQYGPTPLMPGKGDPALARVLQLTVMAETELNTNPLLAAAFAAPEADKRNWSVRGLEERTAANVAWIAGDLGQGPWFAGEVFTVADIAISTAFGMWRGALGHELPETLVAFQDRCQARRAYESVSARMAMGG